MSFAPAMTAQLSCPVQNFAGLNLIIRISIDAKTKTNSNDFLHELMSLWKMCDWSGLNTSRMSSFRIVL